MYCINCGARNGETGYQRVKRQGMYISPQALQNVDGLLQRRFVVQPTTSGPLCQYCTEVPPPHCNYHNETGAPITRPQRGA